jgi:electron transfer flavoprotein beta subunit
MVNIIVCIKQVLDPEAPTSTYKVDDATRRMTQKGVPPVMSPFDENALEAALRIKAANQAKITVLSLGWNLSKPVLRKALAAGADDLILLEDNTFDYLDSTTTAAVLAAAIKKIGTWDLILTGRQAADWNAGVVGSGIAELLNIPSVTLVSKVEIIDGKLKAERITSDGLEVIESGLPALATVTNELGGLRTVALKEIMAAQKKPITTWNNAELGLDPAKLGRMKIKSLFIPQIQSHVEIIKGGTPEEAGANLALKLKEKKLLA